jgi:ribosomal protein L9
MKKQSRIVICLWCGFLLIHSGCSHTKVPPSADPWQLKEQIILERNYAAADQLAGQLERARIGKQDPLVVATVADVTYLEASSAFGRITSEQVASRLAQLGFNVTEAKLRSSLYVRKGSGEYILSRDLEKIASQHAAVAIVSGTYAVGGLENVISLRAIELPTGKILAGYDYAVPNVPRMFPNPRILY